MGVQYDSTRTNYVVRWYEDGGKRCRRFRARRKQKSSMPACANRGAAANQLTPHVGPPPAPHAETASTRTRT